MSLYVFNINPKKAIVSTDSRMSAEYRGLRYKINDEAKKLYVINDFIITVGGVYTVCEYIMEQFRESKIQTIEYLHEMTGFVAENIEQISKIRKWAGGADVYKNNPYLIEICAVKYYKSLGYNVFYNISTISNYNLLTFPVDGIHDYDVKTFGGIDTDIVRDYFHNHEYEVEHNYTSALLYAYTAASSEKIGGSLIVATNDKGHISMSQRPIRDRQPIRQIITENNNLVAHNIVGEQLMIESKNESNNVKQFKFDPTGAFLNNATMIMQQDGGGQLLFDPSYGIVGGKSGIYSMDGTNPVPSFIDSSGNIIFDSDGMPQNSNFFLDLNTGKPYFRGKVIAESGLFKGVVQASDYQDLNGNSMLTSSYTISSDYLDLGKITLNGTTGNVSIGGDIDLSSASSINFGSNSPVPDYIKSTYIDSTTIQSPSIVGGTITGGTITSNTTISVGTDLTIGNNIFVGDYTDRLTTKMIKFADTATISSHDDSIYISSEYLDFSGVDHITWGNNTPTVVAVFG